MKRIRFYSGTSLRPVRVLSPEEAAAQEYNRQVRMRVMLASRPRSIVMPWICELCHDWTLEGSYAAGACTRCGTARPPE